MPGYGENVSQLVVDCEHGTATLTIIQPSDPAAVRVHDIACARLAVLRHWMEERCGCTAALRRRLGVGT